MGLINNRNFGSNNLGTIRGPVSSHAQNFSTSKLQQKKDIEQAKVSIHGISGYTRGNSSIYRAMSGDNSTPSTSVTHPGVRVTAGSDSTDETRDRLRYSYICKNIKERKAAEAAAQAAVKDPYALNVKTGSGFRVTGKGAIAKQIQKLKRLNPAKYGNLSKADISRFADIVKKQAKAVGAGNTLGYTTKKHMSEEVEQNRQSGKISSQDSQDMKKFISKMK